MASMENYKRTILKQLLRGRIAGEAVALELQKVKAGRASALVVIGYPNSLYSIGSEKGLNRAQVLDRIKGARVVYRLPDNGRG